MIGTGGTRSKNEESTVRRSTRNPTVQDEIRSFVFPVRKERTERTGDVERKLRRSPPTPIEVDKFNRTSSHSTLAPTESPHTCTSSTTATPVAATPSMHVGAASANAAAASPNQPAKILSGSRGMGSSSPLPSPTSTPTSCKGSCPLPVPLLKSFPRPAPTTVWEHKKTEEGTGGKQGKSSNMQCKLVDLTSKGTVIEPKPVKVQNSPKAVAFPTVPETPPAAAATFAMVAVSPAVAPAAAEAKPVPAPAPIIEVEDLAVGKANQANGFTVDGNTRPSIRTIVNYRLGDQLGKGSYGSVFMALDQDNGRMFAVKNLGSQGDSNGRLAECIKSLKAEIDICKALRHSNIVSYLGHEIREDGMPFLFLEYMPGGSISSSLADFGPMRVDCAKRATRSILRGVTYLHTRDQPVMHRDIKGANVLFDVNFNVKLADFGCSMLMDKDRCFDPAAGSVPWMAPDIVNFTQGYGCKVDVWSIGCTLIEMVSGVRPWSELKIDDRSELFALIGSKTKTPQIPSTMSPQGIAFCQACLKFDEKERPTAAELVQHIFFSRG